MVFDAAWWLEEFGLLPKRGGVFDQNKLLMDDLKLFFRAKNQVRQEYEAWKRLHPK